MLAIQGSRGTPNRHIGSRCPFLSILGCLLGVSWDPVLRSRICATETYGNLTFCLEWLFLNAVLRSWLDRSVWGFVQNGCFSIRYWEVGRSSMCQFDGFSIWYWEAVSGLLRSREIQHMSISWLLNMVLRSRVWAIEKYGNPTFCSEGLFLNTVLRSRFRGYWEAWKSCDPTKWRVTYLSGWAVSSSFKTFWL